VCAPLYGIKEAQRIRLKIIFLPPICPPKLDLPPVLLPSIPATTPMSLQASSNRPSCADHWRRSRQMTKQQTKKRPDKSKSHRNRGLIHTSTVCSSRSMASPGHSGRRTQVISGANQNERFALSTFEHNFPDRIRHHRQLPFSTPNLSLAINSFDVDYRNTTYTNHHQTPNRCT
jgi:hypothetical protein